jgi:hypothetical protein
MITYMRVDLDTTVTRGRSQVCLYKLTPIKLNPVYIVSVEPFGNRELVDGTTIKVNSILVSTGERFYVDAEYKAF